MQDCSIFSVLGMEILQFCTKPSISWKTNVWLTIHAQYIVGLKQEKCNLIANTLELLRFSCTNPLICKVHFINIDGAMLYYNNNFSTWANPF